MEIEINPEGVLHLVAGPNGSGKSTLVEQFYGVVPPVKFVNADNIAREQHCCPRGTDLGRFLFQEINDAFTAHASLIYETTLSGKFDNKLIKRARAEGYKIKITYIVLASVEQNLARVSERVKKHNGHNVPEDDVRRRYEKSLFHFDAVCKIIDSWQLYNNAGPQFCLVANGAGNEINIIEPKMYQGFIEHKADVVQRYINDFNARRARRLNLQH
ncbi:MAG: hypothetical protein J6T57_03275 [Alphaproteobacteria bacterium]|nr:hypothetical protein [Alphaproteobacteria bacterium]